MARCTRVNGVYFVWSCRTRDPARKNHEVEPGAATSLDQRIHPRLERVRVAAR